MRQEIMSLSEQHPQYGHRRVTAVLRRGGSKINAKRVRRVRREQELRAIKKQRRMRRIGLPTAERRRVTKAKQVWSWDFVEDQTENGSRFRILTLIDKYTRRRLGTHVAWSIRAVDSRRKKVRAIYIKPGRPGEKVTSKASTTSCATSCLTGRSSVACSKRGLSSSSGGASITQNRPHSSLGYQGPEEFAARCLAAVGATPFPTPNSRQISATNNITNQ